MWPSGLILWLRVTGKDHGQRLLAMGSRALRFTIGARVGKEVRSQAHEREAPAFAEVRVEDPGPSFAEDAVIKEAVSPELPAQACIGLEFGAVRLWLPHDVDLKKLVELALLLEAGR